MDLVFGLFAFLIKYVLSSFKQNIAIAAKVLGAKINKKFTGLKLNTSYTPGVKVKNTQNIIA